MVAKRWLHLAKSISGYPDRRAGMARREWRRRRRRRDREEKVLFM
jgi:hypothetical protein